MQQTVVQMYCSQLWLPENNDMMSFPVSSESSDTENVGYVVSILSQPTSTLGSGHGLAHKTRYAAGVLVSHICVQTH